jgi:raffinose/stachyose/melibiose transport system substrate-binding protein
MINRRSQHTALALDFLKFVTNQANAQTLSATPYGQPSAVVGAVNPSTASSAVVEGVEQIKRASRLDVWLDMGSVPTVADVWTTASQTLISGSGTPRQVLVQLRSAAKEAQ